MRTRTFNPAVLGELNNGMPKYQYYLLYFKYSGLHDVWASFVLENTNIFALNQHQPLKIALPRSWGWKPGNAEVKMQSLIHCTLSSSCPELVCPENHLKNPNHYNDLMLNKTEVSRHKLTLRSLVNKPSKALCGWGVGQLVAACAAHLLQLW